MNPVSARRIVAVSTAGGLLSGLAVLGALRLAWNDTFLAEVLAGAITGTFFFASTGYLAVHFRGSEDLKSILVAAYAGKISTLILLAMAFPGGWDTNAAALAIIVAASAYVVTSTVLFARASRGRSTESSC